MRRIRTARAAATFVTRNGIALVFPSDSTFLPSLWEQVVGSAEMSVFVTGPDGRRTLSPELDRVWSLHVQLATERLACVGKHICNRLALVSPSLLPALYSLTGRSGRASDFRESALLSPMQRDLSQALLEYGPRTGPELRRLLKLRDARQSKRSLEDLQRQLVVTRAGESEQAHGWDAALFDLVARRYDARLSCLPDADRGAEMVAAALLAPAGQLTSADLARVLGCSRADAASTLDRLVAMGKARRIDGRPARWSSRAPASRAPGAP